MKDSLRLDLLAGLITAAVVLPKAMAYASIAGLPLQVGLVTCLVPMAIYALIGTSRPLSVSTTSTLSILVAAELGSLASGGAPESLARALSTLTVMVGVVLLLAALFRLGFVANFISEPVLVGFKAGIALVIVLDQVPKLIGVHFPKAGFLQSVGALLRAMPETSLTTLAVAAGSIAALLLLEHFLPRVPAPLVVVAAGIASVRLFGLETFGVATVGSVPRGLPPLALPDAGLATELWVPAIGIALMSFTETIAAGRAFAVRGEPRLVPNRELLATGLANVGGALLGAMPAGGGTSQTAVNRMAGARTQLAALVTAGMALLSMLVLAPLIGLMPQATLAAVVIVYSIDLIQPADFRAILKVRRTEFLWALSSLAGVVLLGTLKGILVSIAVSLFALSYQMADPPVRVMRRVRGSREFRERDAGHPEDEDFPGLLLIKLEGRVFFANALRIGDRLGPLVQEASPRVVVLDLGAVFDIEYTALKMLTQAEERLGRQGVSLWLVGLNPEVKDVIGRSPLGAALGPERQFFSLEAAVEHYEALRLSAPEG